MRPAFRVALRYFLIWTALGLFNFTQGMTQKFFSRDPNPWQHYLASWMVGVYIWFLLTPAVLWLGRRFPLGKRWVRMLAVHVPASVAVTLVQLGAESVVLRWIGVFPALMSSVAFTFFFLLSIGFHQSVMTYWSLLGVQYAIGWYQRYQERKQENLRLELHSSQLERQLTQAHLSALKMQLQPHFLFNTLNAIAVLVRQQKGREAEEMIARLGDLLRCVLEDVEAQEVPLSRELEYLQLYLSIEQVRFQDRLRVEVAVDPEVLDAAVPHMVLQPIVENAIRHGIGRSLAAGRIAIRACRVGDSLELKVQDDGPGLAPESVAQARGIGLANTRARLAQLYGDAARLSVENGAQGGAVATIVLPCRVAMEAHAAHGAAR